MRSGVFFFFFIEKDVEMILELQKRSTRLRMTDKMNKSISRADLIFKKFDMLENKEKNK